MGKIIFIFWYILIVLFILVILIEKTDITKEGLFVPILVFFILHVIIIILYHCSKNKFRRLVRAIKPEVEEATKEFNSLFSPNRYVIDNDFFKFKNKFSHLFDEIEKLKKNKFFSEYSFKKGGIPQFLELIDSFGDKKINNNKYIYEKYVKDLEPLKSKASEDFKAIFVPTRIVKDIEFQAFSSRFKKLFKGINEICENVLNYNVLLKTYGFEKLDNYEKLFKQKKDKNNKTYYIIKELYEKSDDIVSFYNLCLSENHYFSFSEQIYFNVLINEIKDKIKFIFPKYRKYINKDTTRKLVDFLPLIEPNSNQNVEWIMRRNSHNASFIRKELTENKSYFDNILDYPLDGQQRNAIVTLEDNTLVVSSAGSGKTSTSIAKIRYLLDKVGLKKNEILALSYNRKTATEFKERLDMPGVKCSTFHALAMYIIAESTGEKPTICDEHYLTQCYYKLVKENPKFKESINKFFGELSSMTKCQHEYDNSIDYFKDRELYGIVAPYCDMNGNVIYTKSEEEKKICTWLTTHGVKFLYERPYPIRTVDTNYKQYRPDFTIFYGENNEKCIYLEHFGVDKYGNVPVWFGAGEKGGWTQANIKYRKGIDWKRKCHEENGTELIETTSAMFHNEVIYETLEFLLNLYHVPIRELSEDEKYSLLVERNKSMEESIENLISSFINLMKSNGKTFDGILESIKDNNKDEDFIERNRFLMYEVIKPLFDFYQDELQKTEQVDFTDLILNATELCNERKWISAYKYIIVDEFQDISVDRYKFILALRNGQQFCKTFCVGDDWQSIYRFNGSDMNLFNKFDKYFGYTEKCKIETTYRFGNPLLKRSSKFILKNPNQIEKEVKSFNKNTFLNFIPFVRDYENDSYLLKISQILDEIPEDESILLIARYNDDVNIFPKKSIEGRQNTKRKKIRYNDREMDFMSVHAAKGSEADNVIILNCSQDRGGFPSRISDDPILGYVLSDIDDFEYSEERRLFYVAITRAKKNTYVLYNENMPSVFVTEMIEDEEKEQLLCPLCGKGFLKIQKEALSQNGSFYRNYMCSNSVAGCDFFWRVFYDEEDEIIKKYNHLLSNT